MRDRTQRHVSAAAIASMFSATNTVPFRAAFSRIELMVLVGILALATIIAFAFLRHSRRIAKLDQCTSNLQQITSAFHSWMQDNEENMVPWATFARRERAPERENSWFQFGCLSNYLKSPALLGDPAENRSEFRRAANWTADADGGFFHPAYRDDACSYGLFLDIGLYGRLNALDPGGSQHLVLDRHFSTSGQTGACARGFPRVPSYPPGTPVQWTKEVHGPASGNVSMMDGSAQRMTSKTLSQTIPGRWDWVGNTAHYLLPTRRQGDKQKVLSIMGMPGDRQFRGKDEAWQYAKPALASATTISE